MLASQRYDRLPVANLARENYERIVRLKGANESVALITGEERSCPPNPRGSLATVEACSSTPALAFWYR